MVLLFSVVTVTAGDEETEFTVGGIPREYDDLVGWTAFDDFMENVDAETEVSVHAEAYLYGGEETVTATPEEVAYNILKKFKLMMPEKLPYGNYEIIEQCTAYGYVLDSAPIAFKLRCPECGRVFRHQVVNGKAHWIGSCRSSGATECQHRHVREDIVYDIFTDMVIKLKTYRAELLGTLIHQMETMQDRTSRNQERIRQIDKEIADLGAKNHVIARLHTSGAMNAADYAMQTSGIGNRLTELRIERRQKLTEDEDDQLLATLKDLNIGVGLEGERSEDNSIDLQVRIAEIDAEFRKMLDRVSTDTIEAFDEETATRLMNEKSRLQQQLDSIADAEQRRENAKSRLDDIYMILDGIKNRPMEYDDRIVRQLLECVVVDSKEQITVIFKGGLKSVQPLTE